MANHWYKRDGSPLHQVEALNGQMRNTTLRDARKLNLVPSVMTILSIIDKPGLIRWQVEQGILSALTLGREENEPDDIFLARLHRDSKQQVYAAGEEGDKIHDACSKLFSGRPVNNMDYLPHAEAAKQLVTQNFPGVTDWKTEYSFAHPLGFGGAVDLHSPSTGIVIDFKGKEFNSQNKKVLAFEQHYQLGGYQIGLNYPVGMGMNIFISRTEPGYAIAHVWDKDKMQHGREVFLAAFSLWKAMKKFDPAFARTEEDRKLMTDAEWEALSAESRFKINEYIRKLSRQ